MIKILDQIDLTQFDKYKKEPKLETYKPNLDKKLAGLSLRLNKEYGDFVSPDGIINISGQEAVEDDNWVEEQEKIWAEQMHQSVDEWKSKKEKNASNITEMAVTVLLDKAIGSRFVVVRASNYDDYRNGVDNVIVDKETGTVVCGFDEVIGHEGDDGAEKKSEKIKKIMAKGGASLKYGLGFNQDNKLDIKSLDNLPAFYLSLSKKELQSLLASLDKDSDDLSESEQNIMSKFVDSLEDQRESLLPESTNPALKDNLDKFQESLLKMKKLIS